MTEGPVTQTAHFTARTRDTPRARADGSGRTHARSHAATYYRRGAGAGESGRHERVQHVVARNVRCGLRVHG